MPQAVDRDHVSALARGLEILACFTPSETILGNKEISQRTRLPKATVARLTYTLCNLGYLVQLSRVGKYRLGSAVLTLGYPLLASMRARQVARPHMMRLADWSGGAVSLGLPHRHSIVYVDTYRPRVHQGLPDIGTTRSILRCAMGRAFIASLSASARSELLNKLRLFDLAEYKRFSGKITRATAELRQHGFCTAYGDVFAGVNAVAVPFAQLSQNEVLLFNCSVPETAEQSLDLETEIGPELVRMVKKIENEVGLATLV
jgi:DNA-binding IclR family transcriptional regulator